jgi:hypothetical protein
VKDPGLLSRTALSGAGFVRKNFDLRAQAQRLEDTYLKIVDRGE